jgi:uncharacterized membrane protein YkvA (DUF1232 family)
MLARLLILLKATGRDLAVLWYACRNPATPLLVKACAVLMAIYVVSPIDLIPDLLPIVGWLDDMALIALGVPALLKLVPDAALDDARNAANRLLSRWPLRRGGF